MATISQNIKQLGPNFPLHSGTTQDMCLQNVSTISAKLRALGPGQRFNYTFFIIQRWLQTNQAQIGPTQKSHVGTNKSRRLGLDVGYINLTVKAVQCRVLHVCKRSINQHLFLCEDCWVKGHLSDR